MNSQKAQELPTEMHRVSSTSQQQATWSPPTLINLNHDATEAKSFGATKEQGTQYGPS